MRENIFDYLKEYGFSKEDIYWFQKVNDKLYFVDIILVANNIKFFEDKGLSCKEIIGVIKDNPYLLTIGSKRKIMLDNLYNKIFEKEELKSLIIKYPVSYTENPLELEEKFVCINNNVLDVKETIIKYFQKQN